MVTSVSSKAQIEKIIMDQKFINDNICSLNCLGKWIWHGGFTSGSTTSFNATSKSPLRAGKGSFKMSAFERVVQHDGTNGPVEYVKWSREVINTCPENFEMSRYDDDNGAIIILTTGIYEISFNFFVPPESHKPSV